jgi:hypothetical protein
MTPDLRSIKPTPRRIVATYDYTDVHGAAVLQEVRWSPKGYSFRRPDGHGRWINNLDGVSARPLYRLPELQGHFTVIIVEGPKDADALRGLWPGIPVTTNPCGAGKWTGEHTDQLSSAGVREVIILQDNDEPGERHAVNVAKACAAAGLTVKMPALPGLGPLTDKGGKDVSDWLEMGHTKDELEGLIASAPAIALEALTSADSLIDPAPLSALSSHSSNPWAAAQPLGDFLNAEAPETVWLEEPLLAPGAITELFSPRGLGKTMVAYAIGIKLARAGRRVLLLDRDNIPNEVKRRLREWGGENVNHFRVMTRNQVPPLTDSSKWQIFPIADYDLVIVDSLDASTEGVGEKDSAKPSRAFKLLIDIAHRPGGPAVLILGNTVKSGASARGSGIIEDRADIVFEVRDATEFTPTGQRDWWLELPDPSNTAWAQRASRRKSRDRLRLAFIISKFRLGGEPEPFILELDMSAQPWVLTDVTETVVSGAAEAKMRSEEKTEEQEESARAALLAQVHVAHAADQPMTMGIAEKFLRNLGLTRKKARVLLVEETSPWRLEERVDLPGKPKVLIPATTVVEVSDIQTARIHESETLQDIGTKHPRIHADRMDTGRRESDLRQAAPAAAITRSEVFAPGDLDSMAFEPSERRVKARV